MTLKNASLGLKITQPLKEKITDIARSNKKSVNEWVTDVLVSYIESYELKNVEGNEMLSAHDAEARAIKRQSELYGDTMNLVKIRINEMIEQGMYHFFIRRNEMPVPIQSSVTLNLGKLGYLFHVFEHGSASGEAKSGDFLFCTNKSMLDAYKDSDNEQPQGTCPDVDKGEEFDVIAYLDI